MTLEIPRVGEIAPILKPTRIKREDASQKQKEREEHKDSPPKNQNEPHIDEIV